MLLSRDIWIVHISFRVKQRLRVSIAIMNLCRGKVGTLEIALITKILDVMRDAMMAPPEKFSPATSFPSRTEI